MGLCAAPAFHYATAPRQIVRLSAVIATVVLAATALPALSAERQISTTTTGGIRLAGVLDEATASHAPVVLIIPGSGPTDRDGNSPLGVRARPYQLLAAALNAKGITVARIDKRGLFASKDPSVDPNAVTLSIYAADTAAWVEALRKETHAPCIWLLGHSEGSQIAEVAAANTPHLCGLVLASAPAEPVDVIMRTQLHDRLGQSPQAQALPALDSAIDQLKKGQHVDTAALPPLGKQLFRPAVQDFLIEWFTHDPVADLRKSRIPVLVVEGSHDHQVDAASGAKLKAARADVEFTIVDGMNHIWKIAPEDRGGDFKTYGNPDLPLAPQFVDRVASFVTSHASDRLVIRTGPPVEFGKGSPKESRWPSGGATRATMQLIQFLSHLESTVDLTPEHVGATFGNMLRQDDGTFVYRSRGFSNGWSYQVSVTSPEENKKAGFHFQFQNPNSGADPSMICGMNLGTLSDALISHGYAERPRSQSVAGVDATHFYIKNDIVLTVSDQGPRSTPDGRECLLGVETADGRSTGHGESTN